MIRSLAAAISALVLGAACTTTPKPMSAPATRMVPAEQDYFGTKIADPYRWLEDANTPETKAWVAEQNRYTFSIIKNLPQRQDWARRLMEVSNYEKYTDIVATESFTLYAYNSGLQNQPVWYMTTDLSKPGTPVLDPNAWDPQGGLSIPDVSLSPNGRWLAYAVSEGGSDWRVWRILDLQSGQPTRDEVRWSKFSTVVWSADSQGFYYSRFPEPTANLKLMAVTVGNAVYYHQRGYRQTQDRLVFDMKNEPDAIHILSKSDVDGSLVISTRRLGSPHNMIHVKSLKQEASPVKPVLTRNDANYAVIGEEGQTLYVVTDKDAPRRRLVRLSLSTGPDAELQTVIGEPEGRDAIKEAAYHQGKFHVVIRHDVMNQVFSYDMSGKNREPISLPSLGAITLLSENSTGNALYANFVGYLQPPSILRLDPHEAEFKPIWKPRYAFDSEQFEVRQVFYPSKDGTQIPMTILTRKDRAPGAEVPMLLFGYGGFEISLEPRFSVDVISWLERGGAYAIANLRGGDEYGKDWYDAGRLFHKQNVFDDFIAAAEYLCRERYTNPRKLGIQGRSNGGLLVGAVMTQRPDLFAAAVPTVGVLDMLRFHLFTVGARWSTDYLIPDSPEKFAAVMKYSPLHNVRKGTSYPATLVLTGDHDDRVVPAHSYKFIAALQAANAGPHPALIRVETNVGHGAGAPIQKRIEESADVLSFLSHHLGL